jgi:hypothetical protein
MNLAICIQELHRPGHGHKENPALFFQITFLAWQDAFDQSGSMARQIASKTKGRKMVTIPNRSRNLMIRFKTPEPAMPAKFPGVFLKRSIYL